MIKKSDVTHYTESFQTGYHQETTCFHTMDETYLRWRLAPNEFFHITDQISFLKPVPIALKQSRSIISRAAVGASVHSKRTPIHTTSLGWRTRPAPLANCSLCIQRLRFRVHAKEVQEMGHDLRYASSERIPSNILSYSK